MKKQIVPATIEDLRLQVSLQQVMVKELEARVKTLETRNSELIFAVNGLTAVIEKLPASPTPTPEEVQAV